MASTVQENGEWRANIFMVSESAALFKALCVFASCDRLGRASEAELNPSLYVVIYTKEEAVIELPPQRFSC